MTDHGAPITAETAQVILCGTDRPQAGSAPYYIAYSDLVDGYRHAWAEVGKRGHSRKVRVGRNANHPPDPRCPECHPLSNPPTGGESDD